MVTPGSVTHPARADPRPGARAGGQRWSRVLVLGCRDAWVAGMSFSAVPPNAPWRHEDARSGFEVAFFGPDDDGLLLSGCTTAVEDDQAWVVGYLIRLDARWQNSSAFVRGRSGGEERSVALDTDGAGH